MEQQQDFFLSHATADKDQYIKPLAKALSTYGLTFWLDSREIEWGDSVVSRINEGLRNSRFALVCLSKNFLRRPWPENELDAVLALQNMQGVKRVLPLILNSREEVLQHYPLLAGLAYREFDRGPELLAAELATIAKRTEVQRGLLRIVVESVHSGHLANLLLPDNVSVQWVTDKAKSALGVRDTADIGAFESFRVRWVLVDTRAEPYWEALPRSEQRRLTALVSSAEGVIKSFRERDRLQDLKIYDGIVFHLYAIEDERYLPPPAMITSPKEEEERRRAYERFLHEDWPINEVNQAIARVQAYAREHYQEFFQTHGKNSRIVACVQCKKFDGAVVAGSASHYRNPEFRPLRNHRVISARCKDLRIQKLNHAWWYDVGKYQPECPHFKNEER